jgi:hypothetical protein
MYVLNIPLPHWTAVAVRLFEKSRPFTVESGETAVEETAVIIVVVVVGCGGVVGLAVVDEGGGGSVGVVKVLPVGAGGGRELVSSHLLLMGKKVRDHRLNNEGAVSQDSRSGKSQ